MFSKHRVCLSAPGLRVAMPSVAMPSIVMLAAVTLAGVGALPARSDQVIQGWFQSKNSNLLTLKMTDKKQRLLEFSVTPATRYFDAQGKKLGGGLESPQLKKGAKIVVTTTDEFSQIQRLKVGGWK